MSGICVKPAGISSLSKLISCVAFLTLFVEPRPSALSKDPPPSNNNAHIFESMSPEKTGLSWVHENAMSDDRYLPETLGPGCAFLDYDGDGWMDIYMVNSGPSDFYQPEQPLSNALYRNNQDGTFVDVTKSAGVAGRTFGMGVTAGDFNNDGHIDIFVTSYGRCILYRNDGDGTFTDVTEIAGVAVAGWTTSAAWFDYNNDGFMDLFVCSFVEYGVDKLIFCGDNLLGRKHYCIPRVFKPTASLLFRNNRNDTFTEVGKGTDIERALGKALGVVSTDVNNDRLQDLFVANDTVQNFLFMNRGNDRWEEVGLSSEVGYSEDGKARSGMGVDAADFNADGWQDLFVANVDQEMFSLYANNQNETFHDAAFDNGVAQATRFLSGWGLKFMDFDNDGDIDLLLANGHPDDMIEHYATNVKYKMPLRLFRNNGTRLNDISDNAGPVFSQSFAARGLAVGDYNNDGRLDVLIGNNGAAPLLLRNASGKENNWIGLMLQAASGNPDPVGTRIIWSAGGVRRSMLKTGGGSYLSSHDPRVVLGVADAKLDWLEIHWPPPSRGVERLADVTVNQYVRVVEGKGILK